MTPLAVRVLRLQLRQPAAVQRELDGLLPPNERDVAPPRRVARAAARVVLGSELGVPPGELVIGRVCEHCGDPSHGRPVVAGAPIVFSLSHSGGRGLLALTTEAGAALGVDIEQARPRRDLGALAARVLNPAEYERFRAASPEERLHVFLAQWTAKEAQLKARGTGITRAMRTVTTPSGWSTVEVDAGAGAVGALAVGAPIVQVSVGDWRGLSASDGTGD